MANGLQLQDVIFSRSILDWVPQRVTLAINKYGNLFHPLSGRLTLSLDLKRNSLPLPMLPCKSLMIVKESPDRKEKKSKEQDLSILSLEFLVVGGCVLAFRWSIHFYRLVFSRFFDFCGNLRNVKKTDLKNLSLPWN